MRNGYARYIEDDRERIIEEFIPVIKHLAYKVSKGSDDETIIDDLISAGVIGLLEAIEKYDPGRGAKLNTFAYMRIRGAMIDELRARDWFPRSARAKSKRLEEAIGTLEGKLGRYPREEEVAEAMNMDVDDYLSLIKDYRNLSVFSIDDLNEIMGDDREKVFLYATNEGENPESSAEIREIEEILGREIDKLPEKQKLVLSLYYREDMNMKEIAEALNITEARVCQIHSQAILNLRTAMKKIV
ncbi:MAG: FliA/WhiG family RNA polymerase sigma factor [Syntrophorhabdaceae bacterium]|nr:FliA/WhiG family RNA polymerase sigma factor [Syntrophorhabdaceae bacterium]